MGKYDPLRDHLADSGESLLKLSFTQIERILGEPLPDSARTYPAWWSNEAPGGTHVQAAAWLDAGYRTQSVDRNAQTVEFTRSK